MAEDRMLSDEILLGIINSKSGGGGGGTNNYNDLSNQPQINNNTLIGNKTASDLGLVAAENGKGLSTNDYTNEDKAIVSGVTAALTGKQDVLTAGKYIDIDANNKISVDREIPDESFTYTIQQTGDGIVKITKTVNGAVVFEETYSGDVDVTLDALHYVYNAGVQSYTLLIASDTHEAGFKQVMSWWQRETYTENFSTVDHSGEKLVVKSELDAAVDAIKDGQSIDSFADVETALATKADLTDLAPAFSTATAYTVGQYVSYDGNIYKCTSAHSAGAWVAGDFTLVAVGSELESKQDKTDNSLQTTSKTVVGGINELKSGLTNVQDDVKLNTQDLTTPSRTKNLLPMSLDIIKQANPSGTWNNNVYSYGGVSFTVNTDTYGHVISIVYETTATTEEYILLIIPMPKDDNNYYFNGGINSDCFIYIWDKTTNARAKMWNGTDASANATSYVFKEVKNVSNHNLQLLVRVSAGVTSGSTGTFYPMLCASTETNTTFAPYIPSVESRIEAVESGIINVRRVTSTTTAFGDVSKPSDISFDKIVSLYVDGYMKYAVRTNDSIKIYQMNNSSLTADSAKVVAETEVTLVIMYVN